MSEVKYKILQQWFAIQIIIKLESGSIYKTYKNSKDRQNHLFLHSH
jgi:hypothetical protein